MGYLVAVEMPVAVASVLGGIILLGGALKAMPVIWNFLKATAKAPAMIEAMYAEFYPNAGSTLRDAVNRLEVGHATIIAWQDSHAMEDMVALDSIREETERLTTLATATDEYVHRRMHDVLNRLTPVVGWVSVQDRRLKAIEDALATRTAALRANGIDIEPFEPPNIEPLDLTPREDPDHA